MLQKSISIFILLLFPLSIISFAQDSEYRPVKYKKIRKAVKQKNSEFYYPVLFERYLKLDTSLSVEEFRHLYYGYSFQDDYRPYGIPHLQDSLISYLSREGMYAEEYEVAARIGGELLKASPFRLRETFITAVSYEMAGNMEMSNRYFSFFEKQAEAILQTGDGLSTRGAFFVIYIQDEYELLELLGFTFSGQQYLLRGGYDMLEVERNPAGIDALYFDVDRLLNAGND